MKCNSIDKAVLYILTNTEGEKFLGHTASLVNPCGDYWEKDSYVKGYVREGDDELIQDKEILSAVRIEPFDCYYWDENNNDYVLYTVKYPESEKMDTESSIKRMHEILRAAMDLESSSESVNQFNRLHQISKIRSWLLINAKCNGPVYIDSELNVSSKGEQIAIDLDCIN